MREMLAHPHQRAQNIARVRVEVAHQEEDAQVYDVEPEEYRGGGLSARNGPLLRGHTQSEQTDRHQYHGTVKDDLLLESGSRFHSCARAQQVMGVILDVKPYVMD